MCRFECSYSSKGPYTPVRRLTRGPGVLNVSMLSPTLCLCFLYLRSKFLLCFCTTRGGIQGTIRSHPRLSKRRFPPRMCWSTLSPIPCYVYLFFFQANFHFLLHNPAWKVGDASLASPALQEAFFDPDVLVDWDTVDTVRLFRHVSKSKKTTVSTVSPRQGGNNGRDDRRSRDEASLKSVFFFFAPGGGYYHTLSVFLLLIEGA